MGLLQDISKEYRTISIVGMAKNAGKTTALNYLIEEACDEGLTLGITSTGRDGETVDLVTETEKPKVYLYEDTIVSVPKQLFPLAEASMEILSTTKYRTSLGELYLCRVKNSGNVQIAGPVATADTKKMCDEMISLGVDLILIDGAIDRKSVAAPESSDAVIISTGAVLSRDMKVVIRETSHIVELYTLPEFEDSRIRSLIDERMDEKNILIIKEVKEESGGKNNDAGGECCFAVDALDLKTGLGSGKEINEAIDENTKYVFIPGAITNRIIEEMDSGKLKNIEIILNDPTKIFIDSILWKKMKKRGMKIQVLKNIKVCALTVNPISPEGYYFDREELVKEMQAALPGIPVIDVKKEA